MTRLRITEIFYSIQGESKTVGLPTVFIRLTGCPLRCGYCDTAYAFKGGQWMTLDEIIAKVKSFGASHVTVTGGEPLAQPACLDLLTQLCDHDDNVSLETSGALDIAAVDSRVVKVMDLKTPGSGECEKNRWENLNYLNPQDQIKFVLCDRDDYVWAKEAIEKHHLTERCELLFSPSYQQLPCEQLADWILTDGLQVRMQVQLHKIIWGEKPGV